MIDLKPREEEIVRLVASGLSNKEIATALGITHQTVKNHLNSVYRVWQVNDRTQAAICVFALGIMQPAEAYRAMIGYTRRDEPEGV